MTEPVQIAGSTSCYRGRFAPSPTGPLHMGSLIAALASYLDARSNSGVWLLRMEDLDPPREPEGAADTILKQLDELGLHWDGEVLYQSQRLDAYQVVLDKLAALQLSFPCNCTRQRLRSLNGVYDGHCRKTQAPITEASAIRVDVPDEYYHFTDSIQGEFGQNLAKDIGDFVVRRKDGLFAYQLAVIVDDEFQQITDIVRGQDLLDSTPRQLFLQRQLGFTTPRYAHIPIMVNQDGEKLSKQRFAAAVDPKKGPELLFQALAFLGQSPEPELLGSDCPTLLAWGTDNWDIQAVPKLAKLPESAS